MKQQKKVEFSTSFDFQCHFLGHMQTLGKYWFLLTTTPGLSRTNTWAECWVFFEEPFPTFVLEESNPEKTPATEKQNAHLKLRFLKVFLEHNRQMFQSFLLPSVSRRHKNTFSVVTASVTQAISEKIYFKKTPQNSPFKRFRFLQMEKLLLKEYFSF